MACLLFPGTVALVGAYEIKEDRQISTQKPVLISASELTFDRLLGLTVFKGNVKAIHKDVTLTAQEIRALSGNRQATADGGVQVNDPTVPMGLSCGNLDYQDLMNLMTAHENPVLTSLDEDGRPITILGRQMEMDSETKTVYVNQDVKIYHDWGKGEAGKATYLAREDKLIMEDDPQVSLKNGWLSGRRIVTRLGGERSLFVEGMAEGLFDPNGGSVTAPARKSATPSVSPVPTKTPEPFKPGNWRL